MRRSRRRFLTRSAAATAAGVAMAPALAQGPLWLRMQSAWPAKHLFHEYALDFAKKVNDMGGGELRIEMVPLGAAGASRLLDAVASGSLDGAYCMLSHHHARHAALALWGSSPAFGMDANMLLAWHKYGGGRELLAKLYASLGADVVSFLAGPQPAQPLGWFKKRIARPEDFNGLRFRADAVAAALFAQLGAVVETMPEAEAAAAMAAGTLDGAELTNPAVDQALGMPAGAEVCMLQSLHQAAEPFEILLRRGRFHALPARLRAIIENASEAASQDVAWKSIDRYSQAYDELRAKSKVSLQRTPEAVLQRELVAHDAASAQSGADALYSEVEKSQRRFAERALRWRLETTPDAALAYRHYFDNTPPRPPNQKKR